MSIPLIQEATKDAINTSIIAIKRNIERINMLLGLVDNDSPDLSGLATKQELQDAVNSLQPVDEVTLNNMQSVTSNAVAKAGSYSTEEHFTGRYWHNGKKIYEKTYNLINIITDGRAYTFDVSSLHIDEVTKYEGYINRTVQSGGDLVVIQYDWNFYDINNTWGCIFRQKTPQQDIVLYRARIEDSITTTGVVSLLYTKTTD